MAQGGPARTEPLEETPVFGCADTCPELCSAWGRRRQVTEGSGAGAITAPASILIPGRNKATAPKLDRFWHRK